MFQIPRLSRPIRIQLLRGSSIISRFASTDTQPLINSNPFRVAVIGSGPAGFYTAYRLLQNLPEAYVDMYEALPVPFGLSRFGVAPDHPEVKNCQDKFNEVAQSPKFNYIGNTSVGKDIDLIDLKNNYNSLLFAYGSSTDRELGVPGEHLPGVFSAREFVGWYNGMPQLTGLNPPLEKCETISIIGNGNVALDVARILLCNPETHLKHTDITEEAYEVLKKSSVKHVNIIGRRGILQSAFTTKEIRELINEPGVQMKKLEEKYIEPYRAFIPMLNRAQKRMLQVIEKASNSYDPAKITKDTRTFSLNYLLSPASFHEGTSPELLLSTLLDINVLEQSDITSPAVATRTGEQIPIKNDLVFKSVGYKAVPLEGMHKLGIVFDERRGIIPNTFGRVLVQNKHGIIATESSDLPLEPGNGLYVAGWVKTGPTGVIASTMREAFEVAETIIEDYYTDKVDKSNKAGLDGVKDKLNKATRVVEWKDWEKIDKIEQERGKAIGKPRSKITNVEEMLNVL